MAEEYLAAKFCRALGLDPEKCAGLTIDFGPSNRVSITVQLTRSALEEADHQSMVDFLQSYRLVKEEK